MSRPKIPASVARALRQEAGFGCAECGCPILDYHHIVPWNEEHHFRVEDMVALCPTHHREFGNLDRQISYKVKQNAFNIRRNILKGALRWNSTAPRIKVGGNFYKNVTRAIVYGGNTIFSHSVSDGELKLSIFLPDENFWPEVEIANNNLTASISTMWDIKYSSSWLKIWRAKGEIFFEVDARNGDLEIRASMDLGGERFEFDPSSTNFESGLIIKGTTFSNCFTGMQLGPPGKIHRPNFAMLTPAPMSQAAAHKAAKRY